MSLEKEKIMNYQKVLENIQRELKDYVTKHNLKALVLGVSGGIDSALVAAISAPVCKELGIPLIGRSITITSSNKQEERDRATAVGEAFCTDFKEVDLTNVFEVFSESIEGYEGTDSTEISGRIRKGNLKSRLRMCFSYELSHRYRGCVLGTDNKTESAGAPSNSGGGGLAFFSIGGDGTVDINPIGNLWKTEVYELSSYLLTTYIPKSNEYQSLESCIKGVPSDGLGVTPDGSDLSQIGKSSYAEVDRILIRYHELCALRDSGIIRDNEDIITEIYALEQDVVIKRHLAGLFKALIPYSFHRDLITRDA